MKTYNNIRDSYTIRVPSPDGVLYVHCIEGAPGKLDEIDINVGKAGSSVSAWAEGVKRLINLSLLSSSLSDVLSNISNISSDKSIKHIRSGTEAVFYALMIYRNLHPAPSREYFPPTVSVPKKW